MILCWCVDVFWEIQKSDDDAYALKRVIEKYNLRRFDGSKIIIVVYVPSVVWPCSFTSVTSGEVGLG